MFMKSLGCLPQVNTVAVVSLPMSLKKVTVVTMGMKRTMSLWNKSGTVLG